jgi:hypothetical protein
MITVTKIEAAYYLTVAFAFGIFAGVYLAAVARAYL